MPPTGDLAGRLSGPVDLVAPWLLGATLSHAGVTVRVTEVEAYGGEDDAGSHAFRGRTARNAVMFGPAGRLYCYFTYGMHVCANVVTGATGAPSAVLLRAGAVVDGHALARARRPGASDRDLARGPARLCRALAITLGDNDGDLASGPVTLVLPGLPNTPEVVSTGPRVGLRGAPERPWRFWVADEPTVSTYRPAAPLRDRPPRPERPSAR